MTTSAVRVVIDTNVLVAMIGKQSPYRWIFDRIIQGKLTLCLTTEILLEYQEVLARKNGTEVAENMVQFFTAHPFVERIEPFFKFAVIDQDPDDDKFIDCAVAASADCIVSNDKHFHVDKLKYFPKVIVLTVENFEAEYY